MAKHGGNIYKNGAIVRIKNKRLTILEENGTVQLTSYFADKDAGDPACFHRHHRGVRITGIQFTSESMDIIALAWIKYRNNQIK